MKESFEHHLDLEARKIHYKAVIHIQKCVRMFIARKHFQQKREQARRLQAVIKTYLARLEILLVDFIIIHNIFSYCVIHACTHFCFCFYTCSGVGDNESLLGLTLPLLAATFAVC